MKKMRNASHGRNGISGASVCLVHAVATAVLWLSLCCACLSCGKSGRHDTDTDADAESLRQVLYVQSLYNNHPGEDIVPRMSAVIDSMGRTGGSPYYFAALNVLIDRLFSDGRFAEADSLAVRMEKEANEAGDSVSLAMAKRVRAQMFYKLSQPERALRELEPAASYITHPLRSGCDFGTATSIREWLWIISRELGDTARMNRAGMEYARLVDENMRTNGWTDSTGHYPVSSLAFQAGNAISAGDTDHARTLLDSASGLVLPSLPSRAYEHLYAVRCRLMTAGSDWAAALSDADTLLSTHRDFPWFYLKDLLLKARLLNLAGRHGESARAYSEYVRFHDSLSNRITDRRLHDLTVLYRTEISREQKRAERFRMFALGSVTLLLAALLALALLHAARVRKRNRLLVERLKEFDRARATAHDPHPADEGDGLPPMERLDLHMAADRPYTDPALSRKELADWCAITPEALGQLIKAEKGTSVHAYINSFRLEEARHALGSDSAEGIAELAARLGFGTSRTLQRAFKEKYGMSPSQYRDASREIEASENQ